MDLAVWKWVEVLQGSGVGEVGDKQLSELFTAARELVVGGGP